MNDTPTGMPTCNCEAEVHMGVGFYHHPWCAMRAVPAGRDALRDRARLDPGRKAAAAHRAVLEEAIWDGSAGGLSQDDVDRILAAVLAVLPPPTDRAAVLHEAAEAVTAHAADHFPDEYDTYADQLADLLRRMAAEAQQQTEPGCPDPVECGHEAALGQARQQRDQLAALVRDFRDPDPCRLDHHGYCQAHSWLCSGSPCPHGRAREVLAALDAQPAVVAAVAREAEAHPSTRTWKVESPRRDQWASWGATHDERVWAAASYDDVIEVAPQRAFRLVRATTTYAVEAEHTPTAVSQPGKEN